MRAMTGAEIQTAYAKALQAHRVGDLEAASDQLLAIIENLARNEAASQDPERRIPSTREIASRVAGKSVNKARRKRA